MSLRQKKSKLLSGAALVVVLGLSVVGYGLYNNHAIASQEEQVVQQQPQAMPVTVTIVEPVEAQIWRDFSARMEAIEFAEIRPQVNGRITEIRFQDGQMVKKGDILYVIDPRPYQAALNEANAELASAQTDASLAQKELDRARDLIDTNAISQRVLDERLSRARSAYASVDRAKAMVEQAEINLDYAFVKAPISGRIGRAEIKVGNVVESNANAPLLTSIVATDRIFADFDVDEQTYLSFIQSIKQTGGQEESIPVKLYLNGENGLSYDGVIDSFDNRIDVTNGTIRARAIFDNNDGILIPGMFANIKVGSPDAKSLIMISETAIGTDQDRKFVYVVDDNNVVQYRAITTGDSQKGNRIVTSGLNAGDKVITEGLMRIRPEMTVDPQTNVDKVAQAVSE